MLKKCKKFGKSSVKKSCSILNRLRGIIDLPGTIYQRYSLPLDYLPSRMYEPRWGYLQKPVVELVKMFESESKNYEKIFQEMALLKSFYLNIKKEFSSDSLEAGWLGGPVNALDLAILYYFIVKSKPEKYVEIGSGVSTFFAARAKKDHLLSTKIISIDPEARYQVKSICNYTIKKGLETVNLSIFSELKENDIVFFDGSHRSFMNSDVTVFMMDILPILKPGVIIHFHDIHLPYDYPKTFANWYWNEQYLLAVYLMAKGAKSVKVLMPARFVSYSVELKKHLGGIFQEFLNTDACWQEGGSFWFTKIS